MGPGGDDGFPDAQNSLRWTAVKVFQPSADSTVQVARTSPYLPRAVYNDPLVCTMIHRNKQLSTILVSLQSLLSIILQRGASPSESNLGGIVLDDKTKSLTTSTVLCGRRILLDLRHRLH